LEVEPRRFKRYIVEENKYEVFSRELGITGKLKDISEGGLAYQYIPDDGGGSLSEVVDILGKNLERLYLPGLICKRVYDIAELAADLTFTGTKIRIRGLEFTGLSEKQKRKIEVMLEKYQTG